jgi:hypothetical protein
LLIEFTKDENIVARNRKERTQLKVDLLQANDLHAWPSLRTTRLANEEATQSAAPAPNVNPDALGAGKSPSRVLYKVRKTHGIPGSVFFSLKN